MTTRASRRWRTATVLTAVSVLVAGPAALAATEDRDTVPIGTVDVDGQSTPILGTFAYHQSHDDTKAEIRGLVHGVRRVDGGTVLYYSVGTPSGGAGSAFTGSSAFPTSTPPYGVLQGVDLTLIDTERLTGYLPLHGGAADLATYLPDLDSGVGELRVGFAVFPELPADVETVQVVMPFGTAVGDVPVEDGPLEPVGDDPAPLLGDGWPEVPEGADLAGADPAAVTLSLLRRSGDAAGTTVVEESPEEVSVTLDANVLFASGSADLSPEAQGSLATVAADIAARGTGEVVVTGHTDSDGSDDFNQTLSEQRAAAVLAVLQPASGSAVTFTSAGRGESEPIASNATDEGKQQNRRVTVVYSVGEQS